MVGMLPPWVCGTELSLLHLRALSRRCPSYAAGPGPLFLGDAEQARFNLHRALERNPQSLEARIYLAAVDSETGDRDAATWQASAIRTLKPAFSADTWLGNYPLADPAQRMRLRAAMVEVGL